MKHQNNNAKRLLTILLLLFASILAACGGNAGSEPAADDHDMEEMDDDHDMEEMGDDHEHDDDAAHPDRIANEGAAVRIISPETMSTFSSTDQILVEIETENFELGEGNHWHVYIDGASWGMVMGNNTDQPLTNLEPGEHEIAVYLSIDSHEELEEGDAIMVTITE